MFTEDDRNQIRARLLERAREDRRVTSAAITGSASRGAEDRWSDIDLFFGVAAEIALEEVLGDWSEFMYQELGALHHFDLQSGSAIYRAFLLPECLEVDLAFTLAPEFGALGPHFRLVFGEAIERPAVAEPDRDHLIGLAWHHVLHARICIERNKLWQAEYWISGVRDHALALACLRFDQPARYAKGIDGLPSEVSAQFGDSLVRTVSSSELRRALGAAAAQLLRELREANADLARQLEGPLLELAPASQGPHQVPGFNSTSS
jgi:predicted nucleotidyltransferase